MNASILMLFQLLIKPNLNIESEMQKIGASVIIELAHTQVVTKTEIFIDGHGIVSLSEREPPSSISLH